MHVFHALLLSSGPIDLSIVYELVWRRVVSVFSSVILSPYTQVTSSVYSFYLSSAMAEQTDAAAAAASALLS